MIDHMSFIKLYDEIELIKTQVRGLTGTNIDLSLLLKRIKEIKEELKKPEYPQEFKNE